jgi:beta-galactosidase
MLLPAGYAVAKNQLTIRPYKAPDLSVPNRTQGRTATVTPFLKENDRNFLIAEGENFRIEFGRKDGFLCRYEVNGKPLLKDGGKLTPNFGRATTDNDMGLSFLQHVWKNPDLKLVKLNAKTDNGRITVHGEYAMQTVSAVLFLDYTITHEGAIQVTQKLSTDRSANVPDLFCFGMQLQLPYDMDRIEYYGRGPVENYIDRNNATDLGIYTQTVDEQFYPYIRPQETGTKTDIRRWVQSDVQGNGLRFIGDTPFSASALHYSVESLDDGWIKKQRHSELVKKVDYTNFRIDKKQMGVWHNPGGFVAEQYRLPYGDYEFTFIIYPVQHAYIR